MPSQTQSFINKTNNSDMSHTSISIYYGFRNNKNDFQLQKKKYTSSLKFNEILLLVSLYLFFLDAENSGDCPGLLLTLVANILTSFPSPQSFSEQSAGHSPHPVARPRAHSRTGGLENAGEKALIRLTLQSLPRGPVSG